MFHREFSYEASERNAGRMHSLVYLSITLEVPGSGSCADLAASAAADWEPETDGRDPNKDGLFGGELSGEDPSVARGGFA